MATINETDIPEVVSEINNNNNSNSSGLNKEQLLENLKTRCNTQFDTILGEEFKKLSLEDLETIIEIGNLPPTEKKDCFVKDSLCQWIKSCKRLNDRPKNPNTNLVLNDSDLNLVNEKCDPYNTLNFKQSLRDRLNWLCNNFPMISDSFDITFTDINNNYIPVDSVNKYFVLFYDHFRNLENQIPLNEFQQIQRNQLLKNYYITFEILQNYLPYELN